MNKADLIEKVKDSVGLSKSQAESAVDEALSTVMAAIKGGERVTLFGFGSFTPANRAARTGRNPRTGEPVKIAATNGVRFAPAAAFKAALNPPKPKKAAGAKKAAAAKATKATPAKKAAPAKKATAAKKAAKSTKKR